MASNSEFAKTEVIRTGARPTSASTEALEFCLHPAWRAFMRFCRELRFGEIEQLKIQDGLPFLAEVTKKKVKFT